MNPSNIFIENFHKTYIWMQPNGHSQNRAKRLWHPEHIIVCWVYVLINYIHIILLCTFPQSYYCLVLGMSPADIFGTLEFLLTTRALWYASKGCRLRMLVVAFVPQLFTPLSFVCVGERSELGVRSFVYSEGAILRMILIRNTSNVCVGHVWIVLHELVRLIIQFEINHMHKLLVRGLQRSKMLQSLLKLLYDTIGCMRRRRWMSSVPQ